MEHERAPPLSDERQGQARERLEDDLTVPVLRGDAHDVPAVVDSERQIERVSHPVGVRRLPPGLGGDRR